MRSQVQLSENGSIACRQLELASRGSITIISAEKGARRLRRIPGGRTTTTHKDFAGAITELGPREIRVQCSSQDVDRAGDQIIQAGIRYAASVPVLWSHNAEMPIGRARPYLQNGVLMADISFAPLGVSETADMVCRLVKNDVVSCVSIGFDPDADGIEPMDRLRPRGPFRYLSCELLEVSVVTIGANRDATVISRAFKHRSTTARSVPMQPADPLEALRQNVVQARSRGSVHLCHALRAYEQARAAMISDSTYRPAVSRADAAAARAAAAAVYEQLVKGEP